MADKFIQVPKAVQIKDLVTRVPTGEVYEFFNWLVTIPLMDLRFSMDWKTNRAACTISDAFFGKKEGTWVRVSDSDYDILKAAAEEPQRYDQNLKNTVKGYASPALFQHVMPFIKTVQDAVDTDPSSTT
jgi:hypothetical protein